MIETVMIFALGFLVAGLLTLLFLPAFWRRAMRLSTRRLELRMPLSMAEIAAERDQLRAEFAAERRKLEQSSEKLAERLALVRAELGVRAKRILALEDDLTRSREDAGRAEEKVLMLERNLNEVDLERAAIEKALYDTSGMLERRLDELRDLSARHAALQDLSDERRMQIAGLETRISGLEVELEATEAELARTRKQLAEKVSLAQFLEHERDQFQADLLASRARREQLREDLSAAQAHNESLVAEIRAARREAARLHMDHDRAMEDLAEAQRSAERLRGEIAARIEAGHKAGQEAAVLRDAQRTQQAALQGALDAARRDNQMLRAELGQLRARLSQDPASGADRLAARAVGLDAPTARPASGDDMALLRKAIADLGSDIVRVAASLDESTGANSGAQAPPANDTSGRMHDPAGRTRSAGGAS